MNLSDFLIINGALVGFYLFYRIFLHSQTHFRWSRMYLLLTMPLAAFLPYGKFSSVHVPADMPGLKIPEIALEGLYAPAGVDVWEILVTFYAIIAAALLLYKVTAVIRISLQMRTATPYPNLHQVFESPVNYSFSFLGKIYLEPALDQDDFQAVLAHELVHRRQLHTLDLILADIFCCLFWINPVLYLYRRRLAEVHEFLADAAVTARMGPEQYQQTLVAGALGIPSRHLINFFLKPHTLKQRIMMMNKSKSRPMAKLRYLAILPVVGIFVMLAGFDKAAPENLPSVPEVAALNPESAQIPDTIQAEYPGGIEALMSFLGNNIKYPEEALSDSIEGTVFAAFVISKKGKPTEIRIVRGVQQSLDDETIRVLKAMPDWKPARAGGEAIAMEMMLPVRFQLAK